MTNGGVDRSIECTGNINAMISAFECVHDVCIFLTWKLKFSVCIHLFSVQ